MKNLFKKIAGFQQEVPVIHKGTQGYGYSYADLPAIFEKINPLLKKHGLGFTQLLSSTSIKTIIFDVESGEQLESIADIPQGVNLKGMNDFQVLGSAITYIRRYALSAALGLVTDVDNDAAGEQVKTDKKETPAKKEYPEDNRPWLSEKALTQVLERILTGDNDVAKKTFDAFKMKKEYRIKINEQLKKCGQKECDATEVDIY
jgi:hypothetical protein